MSDFIKFKKDKTNALQRLGRELAAWSHLFPELNKEMIDLHKALMKQANLELKKVEMIRRALRREKGRKTYGE